ncbi:tape measure protein [Shinella zoogloeoides]|uniref:tape measure protein n=1 Tax=Shinella zoogloeoides TaxID=352475 RepID=UPI0028AF9F5E|nr:tape measure protein [Shinella zoogloeoides]
MAGETEQLVVALEARIRDFERNFQRASRTADSQFSSIERRAQRAARELENSLRSSTANITKMLGTIGVGVSLNELRQLAERWTDLTSRVNVAVGSQEKGAAVMARISTIARRTYSDIGQTTDAFVANNQALKDLGYSTQTQLDYTEALNNALVVSGAKGQRAESVMNALAKAMALGELRGENLNTVISTGGRVAQALADGLGVTVNELRKMGTQGKLTGDILVKALTGQLTKLREEAESMEATISDSFVIMKNAMTEYIGKLNEAGGVTSTFANGIIAIADNFDTVAQGAAAAAAVMLSRYVPGLARVALAQAAVVATNPFLLLATAIGGAAVALSAFGDEIQPVQGELANLQDYAGAAWDMIKEGASEAAATVRDAFLSVANMIADALGGAEISMADLADFAKQAANNIINAFVLVYDTIVVSFTKLPQAVAEAVLNAINALIAGVESGLNTVIRGVNAAVEAINSVGESVGVSLGTMDDVSLGRIRNGFAGAGEEAGRAYLDALRKVTRDRVGEALGSMRERANARAAEREAARQNDDAGEDVIDSVDNPKTPAADPNAKKNAFEREIANIQKRIATLKAETEARRNATGTYEEQQAAIEKARMVAELLNAAQEAGVEITDDVRGKIMSLADAYSAAAEEARKLAKSQQEAAQKAEELESASKDAFKGFITDLVSAKTPAEALLGALNKLSSKLLDMALDALWERIFGPSRGNNIFSTWGKGLATPAPAASPATGLQSIAQAPVQSIATADPVEVFTAPVGKVERAALPPVIGGDLRGSLGIDGADLAKTVQPAMQDAANSFAKSITLTPKEITDLKKTLMTEWVTSQGDAQGKGIIDTILNRKASGKWGDTVTDVVNARKQFSDINGPPGWKKGKRSVDDWSTSDPRYARASRLVDEYLPQRSAGTPSMVGDHLNYANRAHSTPNNFGWIDKLDGPKLGAHRHGTTADLQRFRPGEYGINLPGQSNLAQTPDPMTTGSIAQQQLAAQQQKIVEQQIEAQRRLQQQMQATATSTTAMQPPLQGIGMAATQAVPQIGGMAQGVTGLIGPLSQAVPGLGQFGGAIQQLLQQLLSSPMGGGAGLLGGLLGFADGGAVSGPGTSTSDSIPAMLSDGEYVVNARATRKHRAVLEAINSGKAPAFATGGIVSRNAFSSSSTYAPSVAINMHGSSGNPKQDARFAQQVASAVDAALQKPDGFRRTEGQKLAQLAGDLRGAGSRNS